VIETPEIKHTLEFYMYCSCGNGLCNQTKVDEGNGRVDAYITVEPCEKCLEKAKAESYDEGYSLGYDMGHEDAIEEKESE